MKHSTEDDLSFIPDLIDRLRHMEIKEKGVGHFYFRGRNVIHFHSDSGKVYADIGEERLEVFNGTEEINTVMAISKVYEFLLEIKNARP